MGQTLVNHGRVFTVVGVVPDARYLSLDLDAQGAIYWPVAATPQPFIYSMLVRLDSGTRLAAVLPQVIQRCPDCWFHGGQMLTSALADSIRPRRFSAWLFSSFGLSALVVLGAGILGLAAMSTSRRTREIGIRMALGASAAGVLRQILREQTAPVAFGLLAGGALAAWLVRFVAAYLYKTPLDDPISWSGAAVALLLVASIGVLVPARRASRVDPVHALRAE